jgi:hypothetical protein
VRKKTHPLNREINLKELRYIDEINLDRANHSIGTLCCIVRLCRFSLLKMAAKP